MNPPLTYLIRKPKVSIKNPPLLLLLHGVGSNEKDLFSLTDDLPDPLLIVSLRGPITLGRDRFGWYEISFTGGTPKINADQQMKSQKILIDFLNYLQTKYQFDANRVWIGGFSQGAVMSYSVGLLHPDQFTGIIALSGRLLEETKHQFQIESSSNFPKVYIAHGTNDNVIAVSKARDSKEFLESVGIIPHYKEYSEGHTISAEMLKDLIVWLEKEME
ncbi:Esterase [Leptospira biflexa serovar Patoc strain 'Patoc 1 (Ames)']|uniref:Putative carboxylesterase 2 n=1 Tax=Leptospira biflexa serovar Patoc (strain Patoc 1 / ATCC 23582 / Paris) TaxID=456481 RepID=B0SK48_LEPBP|nr:esterase [Leptospira biflexa]ABZ92593.1 Esterase [Leptospira biflexa serovar Patoc strain 'Patoc 1 (Ames)']ABZ96191.1 Putative carboxylesterase 2 [Leptospira biflexa serovar Patoc strain 'Patoc 1 (Paris)']